MLVLDFTSTIQSPFNMFFYRIQQNQTDLIVQISKLSTRCQRGYTRVQRRKTAGTTALIEPLLTRCGYSHIHRPLPTPSSGGRGSEIKPVITETLISLVHTEDQILVTLYVFPFFFNTCLYFTNGILILQANSPCNSIIHL